MITIKDNNISRIWIDDDIDTKWIYKQQPKFLTDNEIWILEKLYHTGYVPYARQLELEIIKMEFIKNEPVTKPDIFMSRLLPVLKMLNEQGIAHGDLTQPNVLVRDNKPILIDWSEARLACDPRVLKRQEGDRYWLTKTMEGLCEKAM